MDSEILRELEHLERRLKTESDQLISRGHVGMAGGPGGGGFEARDVERLNSAIRKARGIDRIEEHIQELRARLAELEG